MGMGVACCQGGFRITVWQKEFVMIRIALSVLMLGMLAVAVVGCRASGEIGDTASIVAPR